METARKDPVCQREVVPSKAAAKRDYQGREYLFCSAEHAAQFDADPARYITVYVDSGTPMPFGSH